MTRPYTLLLAAVMVSASAVAQPEDGLGAGAALPESGRTLHDASGRSLTLGGTMGSAGLVVAFWSDSCPWADRNADRFAGLATEYGRAGIRFLAIGAGASSGSPASPEALAAALGVPYVVDGAELDGPFGVRSLPTVYFFSRAGQLIYEGAIDDSPADADAVDVPYLRQAMDEYLADLPVSVQRTAALGCALRRR